MKYEILFMFALLLTAFPLTSAAEEELSYEPNETIDIVIKCYDTDSALCSSSTDCYIDIFYPNMTNFVYNGTMTANGTFYNYTASRSLVLGVYHASTYCTDGTTSGYSTFDFYVGRPSTEPQIKITILAIVILIGISALFFFGFLFIQKPVFRWSFFLFFLLFAIIAINVAAISIRNEAGSENIRNIFDNIGAVSYYMYWFIFGLLFILWAFSVLASIGDKWKMKQAAKVGQPVDLSKY